MTNTTNTNYDFLTEPVVEGGIINEQGVLNVALSFFDLNRHLENDASEKEVILFKQILPLAKVFCSSMSDWTFLTESKDYEEEDVYNDEPVLLSEYKESKNWVRGKEYTVDGAVYVHRYQKYKNYVFGYVLPNDFVKMRYIDGDPKKGFAVKGNLIFCNELGCSVDYISDKCRNLPTDFGYLVAYKCAMELAMHLDPEGTALTRASSMLTQTFGVMKQRDDMNFRLQNPAQNQYIDKSTAYWNNGGYPK